MLNVSDRVRQSPTKILQQKYLPVYPALKGHTWLLMHVFMFIFVLSELELVQAVSGDSISFEGFWFFDMNGRKLLLFLQTSCQVYLRLCFP